MPATGALDDRWLMAFADGELSPAEEAEVEALLARVRRHASGCASISGPRHWPARAFQPVLSKPVPPERETRVRTAAWASRLVPLPPRLRRGQARAALPLAAGIALPVGATLGAQYAGPAPDPLAVALDGKQSGEPGPAGVVTLSTWRLADGRLCRRFDRRTDGLRHDGLACRDPEGAGTRSLSRHCRPAGRKRGTCRPVAMPRWWTGCSRNRGRRSSCRPEKRPR
jgi:hypothetical protein